MLGSAFVVFNEYCILLLLHFFKLLLLCASQNLVQELCESRGGRPELSVLTSLLVSVDVKTY